MKLLRSALVGFCLFSFGCTQQSEKPLVQSQTEVPSGYQKRASDDRRPSAADISGVWTTAPSHAAYIMQLEQHGEMITGDGEYETCLPEAGYTFQIEGTYKNRDLVVVFTSANKTEQYSFSYADKSGDLICPTLRSTGERHLVLLAQRQLEEIIKPLVVLPDETPSIEPQ